MASKKKKDEVQNELTGTRHLKEDTVQAIFAVIFFFVALFSVLASFEKAGFIGAYFYRILSGFFGVGYYLVPVLFIMLGISFLKSLSRTFRHVQTAGALLFFMSGLGLIDLISPLKGGSVGHFISIPLIKLLDFYASLIFLIVLLIISFLVTFDTRPKLESIMMWKKRMKEDDVEVAVSEASAREEEAPLDVAVPTQDKNKKSKKVEKSEPIRDEEMEISGSKSVLAFKEFVPPPLSLLERDKGKPEVGDIKANANIIKRTLQNFGINVEMDEISIGPSVTRYALKPAEGVKLSRIVALNNDLALALAAHPIRIEAPIPGKSLVGIEIPNTVKTTVGLASLLSSEEYQQSEKPLLISLGKGITGKSYFANLAKMPHLLIAGATGSGKSVTIHAVITSLLFRNAPENLKFIMIDPKRVELTLYNKIPHLLTPVITDAKKAILSLKWAAREMDRRYDVLESNSVRDVESYHKNILAPAITKGGNFDHEEKENLPETMPYIAIVIDELADIMQAYPRELESAIVRLAQMSRAVGIHLMLSTQRPSVNVITGLIKANVPGRIALQVSSQIDSRTILDTGGAEKLLGAGDMLYLSGEMSKPQRLQSAFISETEVKRVVKHLGDIYGEFTQGEVNLTNDELVKNSIFDATQDDNEADDDDLYEEARAVVVEAGKASTSYIQRKLRVGYARAARLIDMLEERGVIGPGDGARPREVIGSGSSGAAPQLPGEENMVP